MKSFVHTNTILVLCHSQFSLHRLINDFTYFLDYSFSISSGYVMIFSIFNCVVCNLCIIRFVKVHASVRVHID